MENFEKLGVFYLGKTDQGYLLYDSKDLVTHAVCVGMTGSGKTGLCTALLEEAAIDSIPAIIIDPKGDLSNLLLTFPELRPSDFRPWINEDAARSQGLSPDEFAANEAERWRKGLADWGQDPARIQRLKSAADFAIYTPGSTAGLPVSITSSFAAPPQQYLADRELLSERISSTVSGLLGLLGVEADPLRSREHILISNIIDQAWSAQKDVTLPGLIQAIQSPPMQRVGFFDLESFYPSAQRLELAMMLNNLLAAPGFAVWLQGESLDVGRMLYGPTGKPRMSIFSIAHLSERERMFFVSVLLNQTLSWMRTQPGTTSLRAILYMDEIFGFFPPVAEPPSKKPLLTLLKQARAFGVGVVLATQNPVDLDYKGLANTGTWLVGRLQTERDRDRLIDGLTGIASREFDRAALTATLSSMKPRTFLMQNVHEDHPVLFTSRWCLSYLAGPLTRAQIKALSPAGAAPETSAQAPATAVPPPQTPRAESAQEAVLMERPPASGELPQRFAPAAAAPGAKIVYRPFLIGSARIQIVNNKYGVTSAKTMTHVLELQDNMTVAPWDQAASPDITVADLQSQVPSSGSYLPLPTTALQPKRVQSSQKGYVDFAYRLAQMTLWKSASFKITSNPGESEQDFRLRLQQLARERRDFEVDRLRQRYASKLTALKQRLVRAEQRIAREREQAGEQKVQTAISVGATLLGAFMGRKVMSASNLGRATTATRQASKIFGEQQDVQRAEEEKTVVEQQIAGLEAQLQQEADQVAGKFDPQSEVLQQIAIRPTRQDILLQFFGVLWVPYSQLPDGTQLPAWEALRSDVH
jgi:hypothetical protein